MLLVNTRYEIWLMEYGNWNNGAVSERNKGFGFWQWDCYIEGGGNQMTSRDWTELVDEWTDEGKTTDFWTWLLRKYPGTYWAAPWEYKEWPY